MIGGVVPLVSCLTDLAPDVAASMVSTKGGCRLLRETWHRTAGIRTHRAKSKGRLSAAGQAGRQAPDIAKPGLDTVESAERMGVLAQERRLGEDQVECVNI